MHEHSAEQPAGERAGETRGKLNTSPPAAPAAEIAAHRMIVEAARDGARKESEIRVLIALTRTLAGQGAVARISVRRLAERAGTSQRTAQSALRGLEEAGTITRRSAGRRAVSHTTLRAVDAAPVGGDASTGAGHAYETRKRLHAVCADTALEARAARLAALAGATARGMEPEALLEAGAAKTRAGRRTLRALVERGHLEHRAARVRIAAVGDDRRGEVGDCTRCENPEKDPLEAVRQGSSRDMGLRWEATADAGGARRSRSATDDRAQTAGAQMAGAGETTPWPEEIRHLPIEQLKLSETEMAALRDPLGEEDTGSEGEWDETLLERLRASARGRSARALVETVIAALERAQSAEEALEPLMGRLREALEERALEERRKTAQTRRRGAVEKARRAWAALKARRSGLVEAPAKPGQRTPTWWRPKTWPARADSKSAERIVRTRGRTVLEGSGDALPREPTAYHALYEQVLEGMRRTARNLCLYRGDSFAGEGVITGWAEEAMCAAVERERAR